MSRRSRIDAVSLATGLALVAFGVLLACDAAGLIALDLGWAASASAALAGFALLVSGLGGGER